jgi:hypothetical protein
VLATATRDDRLLPRASELLRRALDAGFPRDQAEADADLRPLFERPEHARLLR